MPGGIGQNGSVAWIIKPKKAGSTHSHSNQGNGRGGKISETIQSFTVRLRFPTQADAQSAWNNQQNVSGQWPGGGYVLALDVPARPQNAARTYTNLDANDEPNVDPPWEVLVDWEPGASSAPSGSSRIATPQSKAKKGTSASSRKSKRVTRKRKSR